MSEAFSAIMITQALICAETMSGIAEASTTRKPSTPRTRISGSSTAAGVVPIWQVPAGWCAVIKVLRSQASTVGNLDDQDSGFIHQAGRNRRSVRQLAQPRDGFLFVGNVECAQRARRREVKEMQRFAQP